MAAEFGEIEDLSVDGLAVPNPETHARQLILGDVPIEQLPSLQTLTDEVREKTKHLAACRVTYGPIDDIANEKRIRENLRSCMRYSKFSMKRPRCDDFSRGTGNEFLTVLHLVLFDRRSEISYRRHNVAATRRRSFWRVSDEYEILSSMTLEEVSNLLSREVAQQNNAMRLMPKTYATAFFIDGVVYKDDRSEVDLGDQLHEYLSQQAEKIIKRGPVKSMQSLRLRDMPLVLGKPFVFLHEGEEPQLFLFSDMLFSSAPPETYPLTVFRKRRKVIKCKVCMQNYATKVTRNSKYCIDFQWWCKDCYDDYHFDKDGNFVEQGPNFATWDDER